MITGVAGVLLVNWLFWSGLAIGGVVFAALLDLTGAQWSDALRATARGFWRFLPLSLVAYLPLMVVAPLRHLQDAVALLATYAAGFWFAKQSGPSRSVSAAVTLVLVYAAGFSVLAHDLLMRLDPPVVSSLFPAYVLTANVYGGISAAALVTLARGGERGSLDAKQRRDLAMVLIGAALMWMYLLWSQYLVIWYGNLPDETRYVVERTRGGWLPLAWAVVAARLVCPGMVLLMRGGRSHASMMLVCGGIVVGFWIEYLVLIGPAMTQAASGLVTAVVTGAFAALFALSVKTGVA